MRNDPMNQFIWSCPCCGSIMPEWFFTDAIGTVLGCEDCVDKVDAYTYCGGDGDADAG